MYNETNDSPSYVGYMYNTVYPSQSKIPFSELMLYQPSISLSYYYGDGSMANPYVVDAVV